MSISISSADEEVFNPLETPRGDLAARFMDSILQGLGPEALHHPENLEGSTGGLVGLAVGLADALLEALA